ncbi:acyl-CoA thioester hydrolase [Chitinivorax tropicus]|uniref:Acyl-CoA thioester hydrolase n=1 Tax=Chitinivorax tropicus TaxID=714531 RepID=A0A840MFJ7_9PROT|nr:thioesterase family protein [Chitinivorax tropicus]MBB5017438.1 acyl-CoA thioester hydrolase [Chitinivorax tropicus]
MTEHRAHWCAEVDITVQFYDLDPLEIVWHGNYVKYFEIARCKLFDQIDYNYPQMRESGYAWPVVDLHLRYVKPATFGQVIRVRAEIVEWENRLKIQYLITDKATGTRLTKGSTVQVAVDFTKQELCFVSPPVLFDKLGLPTP